MPVVEVSCKYLRSALCDDFLAVKVILNELPNNHKVQFLHEVYNEKKELLATGSVLLFFIDAHTKLRRKIPELLYQKVKPYFHGSVAT